MILGITGGTGCGKSTLLQVIAEAGGVVIDCDKVYHDLLDTDTALLNAIDARFPGVVEAGQLDRKKLGATVFYDKAALEDLNKITHAAVKQEVLRLLTPMPKLAAIDAIGLFESGLDKLCHITVAVTAPEAERVRRLMARDNIPEAYAKARIAAQKKNEEYAALCQKHLVNDGTKDQFREKCLAFLQESGIIKDE